MREVSAQYPQPTGSVSLLASSSSAAVGSQVVLNCNVVDASGSPMGGSSCTFSILLEPGNDAEVGSKVITKATDASGNASTILRVGSTPGTIIVGVNSGGMQSQVLVQVQGAAPALQPAVAPIDLTIRPPSTGDAGLLETIEQP
jgi:hypothetical protein